ncbi:MAG: hypothetical protein ACRCZC_03185 [Culicoidibacterales bacterium]
MEILLFSLILVVAVLVLTQPLWRRLLMGSTDTVDECASQSKCATKDCTKCPIPQGHLHTYIEKTYPPKKSPENRE